MASRPLPSFDFAANDNNGAPARPIILEAWARKAIAARIESLIALLDAADGDPDLEPEPAEGNGGEDEFGYDWRGMLTGPGCPISDPDCAVDDFGCDDENDDREPEDYAVANYGMDQSRGPLFHGMEIA